MGSGVDTPENATHLFYLREALERAKLSPPKPTNFRVGALLVSFPMPTVANPPSPPTVLSSGYTLELPGNTHAEQCALIKYATSCSASEAELPALLSTNLNVTLYTTLEPCGKRLSGNLPCVQRIINTQKSSSSQAPTGIRRVIFGAKEPGTFIEDSASCKMLDEAGVEWAYVPGLEKEILEVAKAGHTTSAIPKAGTNLDDISAEERLRQETQPRNPKKRMMEVPHGGN